MILMILQKKKKKIYIYIYKIFVYKLGNATSRNYFTTFLQIVDVTNSYLFLAQISGLVGVSPNFGSVCCI